MEKQNPHAKVQDVSMLTEDELVKSLTLISLLAKNLAKKVLLIPEEVEQKEVHKNGNRCPFQEM